MLDDDVALRISARENSVLVVMEITVAQPQPRAFEAYARAVAVRHRGARELDIFDPRVRALDDPDGLAFGDGAARLQMGASADAADSKAALPPDGDVARIGPRVDLDDVAVESDLGRCTGGLEGALGTDAQHGIPHRRLR